MNKLKKNFIFSIVLFAIILILGMVTDGYDETIIFAKEWYWVFLVIPFAIRAYGLFNKLRGKAFDAGVKAGNKTFGKKEDD